MTEIYAHFTDDEIKVIYLRLYSSYVATCEQAEKVLQQYSIALVHHCDISIDFLPDVQIFGLVPNCFPTFFLRRERPMISPGLYLCVGAAFPK